MVRKRTAIVVDDEPITRLDLVQMLEEMERSCADFKFLGNYAEV